MEQINEATAKSIVVGLKSLLDEACSLSSNYSFEPLDGSKYQCELSVTKRPQSIHTCMTITSVLFEYMADHIHAFVKLLTVGDVEVMATWTTVRSMLEAASICNWLFDPKINDFDRISRVFAHRYEGLVQQLKYGKSIQKPQSEINKLESYINSVELEALNFGCSPIRDRNLKRIGIGCQIPSATDLIEQELQKGNIYRLLSAVAHGHTWATSQLNYIVSDSTIISPDGTKLSLMEKHVSPTGMAFLSFTMAHAFSKPFYNKATYLGWDMDMVSNTLESSYDKIQLHERTRFWR